MASSSATPIERWEVERSAEPVLRWICVVCHLLNAEHTDPWWGCTGHWVHVTWEQAELAKAREKDKEDRLKSNTQG